jgi:hypothetical protein
MTKHATSEKILSQCGMIHSELAPLARDYPIKTSANFHDF